MAMIVNKPNSSGTASRFTKMSKEFNQEIVMKAAIDDYKEELVAEEQAKADLAEEKYQAAKEANKEEEEWDFDSDDEISNKIMEERMAQMRDQAVDANSWKIKGHGELQEITEEDFLKTVTKSKYAVVHFYHRDMPRCKIADHHLEKLAREYMATKFVKLDAEKAPFFVNKLMVIVLPCIVLFEDGKMVGRIDGFELMGGDEFPTEVMECIIGAAGVIAFKPPDDGPNLHSIFAGQRADIVGLNQETALSSDDD